MVRKLHSILNDEYWDHHGWTALEDEARTPTANIPEVVELSDEQGDDVEDDPEIDYDGFSDWYGSPSSHDHLCRGRREAVLGTARLPSPAMWQGVARTVVAGNV